MEGLIPTNKNEIAGTGDGAKPRELPGGTPDSPFLRAIINSIHQSKAGDGPIDLNAAWDYWFNYHCGNFARADVASVTAGLLTIMRGGSADTEERKFLPSFPLSTGQKYLERVESDYPGGAQLVMSLG